MLRWAGNILSLVVGIVLLWQFRAAWTQLDPGAIGKNISSGRGLAILTLVLLLMPLNWWLETKKWRTFLRPFLDWPFSKCLRTVLAGLSLSAVTPNRLGEIGGRALMSTRREIPAVLATSLMGSMVQWVVFLGVGGPALAWIGADLLPPSWVVLRWWLLPMGPLFLVFLAVIGRPALSRIITWFDRRNLLADASLSEGMQEINLKVLGLATSWATLRFVTYVIQLYLLLNVFGLGLPFWRGTAGVAAIYFVQAGIPLPPGINLATRAELGILLWGNEATVVTASVAAFSSLFLINVLLPAIPAYWLIVKKVNQK